MSGAPGDPLEDHADPGVFALELANQRKAGSAAVALDSFTDPTGRLAMRIALNNDDMPFLVDSIASEIAAHNLSVHRVLHPVARVLRDGSGQLGHGEDAALGRDEKPQIPTH